MLGLSRLRCLCLWGEHVAEVGQDIEHWAWVSAFSPCAQRNFCPFYFKYWKPVLSPYSLCSPPPPLSISLSSGPVCIQSHSKWFCEGTERHCNVLLLEWMKKTLFSASWWGPHGICHVALFHALDCSVTATIQLGKCFLPLLMLSSHPHHCTYPWSVAPECPPETLLSVSVIYLCCSIPMVIRSPILCLD